MTWQKHFVSIIKMCEKGISVDKTRLLGENFGHWQEDERMRKCPINSPAHLFRGGWGKANKQKSLVAFRNQDHR